MPQPLIVHKYGGSSLSSPERIRTIAVRIAGVASGSRRVIVIVSAMGQSTDALLKLAREVTPDPPQRELDMLLTVGERISMALLSMALNSLGCNAISFTGSQSGIVTNVSHTRALIQEIRADRIRTELGSGRVVIVAGFQGVSRQKEITTLGRGGSDTTAVALAATLHAERCEICSDFPGVFTADPRIVGNALPLQRLGYDEMLELAALGARVLHYRAAEIARRFRVPLQLLSSTGDSPGTAVSEDVTVERNRPTSITHNPDVIWLRMVAPKGSTQLLDRLTQIAEKDIQVLCYHREREGERDTLSLIVSGCDGETLAPFGTNPPGSPIECSTRTDVATVSVIGTGFACRADAVSRVEQLLGTASIPAFVVVTSSLSVTCLVPKPEYRRCVEVLHSLIAGNPA